MMRTFGCAPGSTSIAARFMPSPEVPDIMPTAITPRLSFRSDGPGFAGPFRRTRPASPAPSGPHSKAGRDGFVDRDAEAVHRVVVHSAEVHAVREHDDREVELRIDPERRSGETGVPVGVDAEVATDHRAVGRAERETDPAPDVALFHPFRPRQRGQVVADDGAIAEHA